MKRSEFLLYFKAILKDVAKNRIWSMILLLELAVCVVWNIYGSYKNIEHTWWTCNTLHLFIVVIFLPAIVSFRLNDNGRDILRNVICYKAGRINYYIGAYIAALSSVMSILYAAINLLMTGLIYNVLHIGQFCLVRNFFLVLSNVFISLFIVCFFVFLLYITKRFNITVLIYTVSMFLLILNRYNALFTLTFPYKEEYLLLYMTGKIIFALIAISVAFIIKK